MTVTQSFRIYEVLKRHFNNDADAKIVVEEIEQIVSEKFTQEKENLAPKSEIMLLKSEIMLLRKDIEIFRQDVKTSLAERESSMKSEINKLIIWIVATMLGSAALFITLAKIFFDK